MKTSNFLLSISLVLMLLLGQCLHAQTATFDIDIFQHNRKMKIIDNEVKLERAPFYFRIQLKEGVHSIFVQASFDDALYSLRKRQPIPDFSDITGMIMAEDPYNISKELIMRSDRSWHGWTYNEGQREHKFDRNSILLNGDKTLAYKTVENLYFYDEDEGGFDVSISECLPDIYLFFMTASIDEDEWELLNELNRMKLKIVWD